MSTAGGQDTNAFSFSIVNQKEEEYHIASGKREERGRREKGTNVYFFVFVFGIPICTLKREKWDVHIYLYQSTAFWYKADDCQMHKKYVGKLSMTGYRSSTGKVHCHVTVYLLFLPPEHVLDLLSIIAAFIESEVKSLQIARLKYIHVRYTCVQIPRS